MRSCNVRFLHDAKHSILWDVDLLLNDDGYVVVEGTAVDFEKGGKYLVILVFLPKDLCRGKVSVVKCKLYVSISVSFELVYQDVVLKFCSSFPQIKSILLDSG